MPAGRPSDYTPELAALICGQIAEGKSLRTICAQDQMPVTSTIFVWLNKHEEFKELYARSKEEQTEAFVEEMMDIADDGTNDWMEVHDKDGACIGYKLNGEHVQRSRVRIDTRKWIASKLKPKKYGESKNVEVNHTGTVMHLTADVSATLRFLGRTIENEPAPGITDISDAVSDRPLLAAPLRTE